MKVDRLRRALEIVPLRDFLPRLVDGIVDFLEIDADVMSNDAGVAIG